ncbi:gamma-glutamylcyclotransferase (GGCT)/AIG2-like uncharacterized protein YtfP [Arcanobacterium wilhelmae]|uniref:Gamma-glutamylcyclotransferase (GGCT)/AIG2-like uncharacterized protein YtfP n=1 Tax=Arcanobacterium wilhelmae TaxID=1803177 RepID=A0ABT9NBG9_9ACTO|nr:gamma-glutamylcyclotransferase [Arcanobacterium wilhelmae]MDP9801064.1 gamma-glutamylcyclotransferase (GGCT)/AIG2-like uncharacterized protein YtfP [Arcanobacterium wilhelmae]WFN90420.1 hypothetical protein P8A24_00730 [Arcanobacterium wilhelmae]
MPDRFTRLSAAIASAAVLASIGVSPAIAQPTTQPAKPASSEATAAPGAPASKGTQAAPDSTLAPATTPQEQAAQLKQEALRAQSTGTPEQAASPQAPAAPANPAPAWHTTNWSRHTDGSTGWPANAAGVYGTGDYDSNGTPDVGWIDAGGTMWHYPGTTSGFGRRTLNERGWNGMDKFKILTGIDVDGDSRTDMMGVLANGTLRLYRGTGLGTRYDGTTLAGGFNAFSHVFAVRQGVGGKPTVYGVYPSGTVKYFQITCTKVTSTGFLENVPAGLARANNAGDFTKDGISDAVAVIGENLVLFPGNSSGGFDAGQIIGHGGWQNFGSVFFADETTGSSTLWATGKNTLLYKYTWDIAAQPNTFRGAPASQPMHFSPAESWRRVSWDRTTVGYGGWPTNGRGLLGTGDFDSDSRSDVALIDSAGDMWHYADAGDHFNPRKLADWGWSSVDPNSIVAGFDADGDARTDLVVRLSNGDLYLYHGMGNGRIGSRTKLGIGFNAFSRIFGVRQGVNGHPTIYGVTSGGKLNYYELSGGKVADWNTVSGNYRHLLGANGVDDFNKDGISDAITITGDQLLLFLGKRDGGFGSPIVLGGSGWSAMGGIRDAQGTPTSSSIWVTGRNGYLYRYTWQIQAFNNSYAAPVRSHALPLPNKTKPAPAPRKDAQPDGQIPFLVYGTLRKGVYAHKEMSRYGNYRRMITTSIPGEQLWKIPGSYGTGWRDVWTWAIPGPGKLVGEAYTYSPAVYKKMGPFLDRYESASGRRDADRNYTRVAKPTADGWKAYFYEASKWRQKWVKQRGSLVPSGDFFRR